MKTSIAVYSYLPALLVILNACTGSVDTPTCTYPHQVLIDTACATGTGVIVRALDYGDSPDGFEWTIIALKDTASTGWTPNDVKIDMFAPNTFTIPDSLVSSYPHLLVKATTNCQGQQKHSIYYSFIKHTSPATNCTTWKLHQL